MAANSVTAMVMAVFETSKKFFRNATLADNLSTKRFYISPTTQSLSVVERGDLVTASIASSTLGPSLIPRVRLWAFAGSHYPPIRPAFGSAQYCAASRRFAPFCANALRRFTLVCAVLFRFATFLARLTSFAPFWAPLLRSPINRSLAEAIVLNTDDYSSICFYLCFFLSSHSARNCYDARIYGYIPRQIRLPILVPLNF